ncbi:MAG: type IV pili twitching motility protein PilT [Candidatus Portnoybacteria bacterium RIFCSPLOWO2_01_FULL_43_11]|uniref:Type IV pili twitching motility protein PilT n=4 Tax=Candidatus Portnoyibacteriota TaxID=1817913 RepID=A0A1G2FCC0_9BACT|nr:MAG: type IV pili twitching motility protein PilT [Candidatus Portnoybacteria bacterium RIFCSPHIGHO2_01_FULL_40_12b]OGZ38691.1 MAG: type IV pili twitching motility protein PilT [Candidatus Portnoybacteria bacterium RIFCSPLOWO2_01_FULL_43_11]OGZ39270.1 MAG: type IV pili twitching motility protein PilT [Candidatus Portnoybacteria bacterium RIFCSPHIGHO2_12_FULL_40_11]OGZ41060.1 MAG: type IV pili twitching motility protein PilT [Candidatus Portnoybacteria bacterium RIFCSPLOWO2_02_FULL_40_15]
MNNDYQKQLEEILGIAVQKSASDVHLTPGQPPILRVDGQLSPITKRRILTNDDTQNIAFSLLSEERKKSFLSKRDIDLSFNYQDKARFRINIYHQLGQVNVALRYIPTKIKTIKELNLPEYCHKITKFSQGFFLVVGPSGQGKTTALAALIDEVNHTRFDHIVTIEDPIEYLFKDDKCVIDQREVGEDVLDFHRGLREVFRQDPDVIMIGEMRDPETISSAVTAAETGHLVFATLHTNTAAQTIDRIIDSFPPYQQNQIRQQLASTLLGILSRRLVPKIGKGVINAVELMLVNSAVRNLIREGKTHQIDMVIETSSEEGMISLNRSLADLVNFGIISIENAELYSTNISELRMLLKK